MSRSPPHLTASDIREFQRIYHDSFGKDISYEDAHEQWMCLALLMQTLSRDIPKEPA